MIVFSAIMPHSPHIVPELASRENLALAKKTVVSMRQLGDELDKLAVDTLVVISPHAPMEDPYALGINKCYNLKGSFSRFGKRKKYVFKNNKAIVDKIAYCCAMNEFPFYPHRHPLDYGTLVPLYFLNPHRQHRVVSVGSSYMSPSFHFEYGHLIGKMCQETSVRIGIVASSNLAHRYSIPEKDGYAEISERFDNRVIRALEQKDADVLMGIKKELPIEIDECGLRPILVMWGALHGIDYKLQIRSYEAPLKTGYLTARLV